MSLRDRVEARVSVFSGLKSGQPIESLKMSDAIECQNFRLKEGKLERVNGSQDYTNNVLTETSGGITSLHPFKKMVVVQKGFNVACENSEGAKLFTRLTNDGEAITSPSDSNAWADASTAWPLGADGNLTITAGNTVTLSPGDIKDYNNLTIDVGGVLQLSGSGWVRIGVKGILTLNGVIQAITNDGYGDYSSNAIDASGGPGEVISYSVTPSGGRGGNGKNSYSGYTGGVQNQGNGGGGMGTNFGITAGNGSDGGASAGGSGWDPGGYGGSGGAVPSGNGVNGVGGDTDTKSGGGGGGARGYSGGGIWIKVSGSVVGSGAIYSYGSNGGRGGDGALGYYTGGGSIYMGGGGSGGGGGGGGYGGKIIGIFRNNSSTITTNVVGGSGGAAGQPAITLYDTDADYGVAGSNGTAGSATITNYNGLDSAVLGTIVSELSNQSEERLYSDTWRDRIFLVNGTDTKFLLNRSVALDDYLYGSIGITSIIETPGYDTATNTRTTVIPAFTSVNVASAALAAGTYYYLITLYDSETNSESPALGSLIGESGITQTSPNAFLGPVPASVIVSHNAARASFADMETMLDSIQELFPRVTHFIVYRGTYSAGLYGTFGRVPLYNTTSSMHGQFFIEIEKFLAEGAPFTDGAASISTELSENNGAPPSITSMLATDYLIRLRNNDLLYPDQSVDVNQPDISNFSGFTHVRLFRDQLFGIGAKSPGVFAVEIPINSTGEKFSGVISGFSNLLHGSEVFQPDYWPYVWEIGVGDGQNTTGLAVVSDTALLILKERSTYYISGSSPDNYTVRIMDPSKGCFHRSTIQEIPGGAICLDRSGFVLFNKIGLGEKISKQIQDIVDEIDFSYAEDFYSSYDQENQRYYCTVVMDESTKPNKTLCLDLDSMEWTTESGQEGSARIITTTSAGLYKDLVGDYGSSLIKDFSFATNVTDRGGEIESVWTSGPIDFGDRQHRKRMQFVYVTGLCADDWSLNVEIIPDYEPSRKFVVENWSVESSMSEWSSSSIENLLWGNGDWASNTTVKKITKIPVVCTGYVFQIRIVNKSTNADAYGFEIHNVSCEGVMFKR